MTEVSSLDPRARTLWTVLGSTGAGVASLVLVVPLVLEGAPILGALLLAAATASGGMWARAVWTRFRWSEGPEALELQRGIVVRRASYVPYHRIQQIDVERGPLDRAAGLAKLVLRTASATTDARLPGLAESEAHRLRIHLLGRAGVDDAV